METGERPPLPPLRSIPEFLQGDQWFDEETAGLYLDFTKPYTPPKWTLSHNGIPFAKLGDLHVISGKSGHGKTALMSQFMATILCGECGHLRYELKEVPKPVVLYIDTEQSEDDTIAVKNRVCTLAGMKLSEPTDQFKVVRLRETEDAEERWRQILKVIWEVKPTVAFLDGMLDIVDDYNDQKCCQPIIRKCMKLVTHYNMSLWCVLHENPMADKMVGTLGSILQRKVTECFTVHKHRHEKDKYPTMPEIFFEVEQPKARGKDLDEWCFQVQDKESWGCPVELDQNGQPEPEESAKARKAFQETYETLSALRWTAAGMSRSDLDDALNRQGITSTRRHVTIIEIALDHGMLTKSADKNSRPRYYFHGLNEAPNDEIKSLPFDAPNTETDETPF